jgi:hypothetical protein
MIKHFHTKLLDIARLIEAVGWNRLTESAEKPTGLVCALHSLTATDGGTVKTMTQGMRKQLASLGSKSMMVALRCREKIYF